MRVPKVKTLEAIILPAVASDLPPALLAAAVASSGDCETGEARRRVGSRNKPDSQLRRWSARDRHVRVGDTIPADPGLARSMAGSIAWTKTSSRTSFIVAHLNGMTRIRRRRQFR